MAIPAIYNKIRSITTSDTVDLPDFTATSRLTDAIWVGGAGNLVAVQQDGTTATFTAVAAGVTIPVAARRINASSTTATLLQALYMI